MNKLCMYNYFIPQIKIIKILYCSMLDELGNEFDTTESKLDATMKKVGKVLALSNNDSRQWMAIALLSILLIVVIILFIIL